MCPTHELVNVPEGVLLVLMVKKHDLLKTKKVSKC